MSSTFINPNLPRRNGPLPPRPVVLEPPQEVLDFVAKEEDRIRQKHGFDITPEARKLMLDNGTLDYIFWDMDGVDIAYRSVERGVEVLGLGFEEVMNARKVYGDGPGCGIRYCEL